MRLIRTILIRNKYTVYSIGYKISGCVSGRHDCMRTRVHESTVELATNSVDAELPHTITLPVGVVKPVLLLAACLASLSDRWACHGTNATTSADRFLMSSGRGKSQFLPVTPRHTPSQVVFLTPHPEPHTILKKTYVKLMFGFLPAYSIVDP